MWYNDNSYVIQTKDVDKLKDLLESLGLSFVKEQHGEGPEHYACEVDGKVLEVYPAWEHVGQLKKERNQRRQERGYTDEQVRLWWSGIATAWRLLRGYPPPEIH